MAVGDLAVVGGVVDFEGVAADFAVVDEGLGGDGAVDGDVEGLPAVGAGYGVVLLHGDFLVLVGFSVWVLCG